MHALCGRTLQFIELMFALWCNSWFHVAAINIAADVNNARGLYGKIDNLIDRACASAALFKTAWRKTHLLAIGYNLMVS